MDFVLALVKGVALEDEGDDGSEGEDSVPANGVNRGAVVLVLLFASEELGFEEGLDEKSGRREGVSSRLCCEERGLRECRSGTGEAQSVLPSSVSTYEMSCDSSIDPSAGVWTSSRQSNPTLTGTASSRYRRGGSAGSLEDQPHPELVRVPQDSLERRRSEDLRDQRGRNAPVLRRFLRASQRGTRRKQGASTHRRESS